MNARMGAIGAFGLLYKLRLKILPRYLTTGNSHKRWQYGFGLVFGAIAFSVVLFVSLAFFRFLIGSGEPDLASAGLSAVFNLTVVILTVTGVGVSLYTLYLSDDLEILSATPVKERAIFSYKFMDTMLTNSWLLLISALPISLAYGLAAAESALSLILFLAVLPVVLMLLLVVPTALCILFSMPLMRILPASKAKEIVAVVGAIFGAGFYLVYLSFVAPDPEGASGAGAAPGGVISALRPLLETSALGVPPGSWASAALSGSASLDWISLLPGLGLLCALCAAAYLLCLTVSAWAYATGRAQAAESSGQVGSSELQGPVSGRLLAPLPRGVRAVAFKELRSLRRDLRRLSTVGYLVVILLGAFFINFRMSAGDVGDAPWFVSLLPYLLPVVVGGLLASLLAAYSVGAEGRAYWYLHASPLRAEDLMAGKLAASVLCGAGVSFVVSVVIAFVSGSSSAFVAVTGILCGVLGGAVAAAVFGLYGIGISAMFANFEGENPNQTISQAGNLIMMFLFFGLLISAGLAVALAFGLSTVIPVWLAVPISALAWTGGCAAGGYAMAASGARSLELVDQ